MVAAMALGKRAALVVAAVQAAVTVLLLWRQVLALLDKATQEAPVTPQHPLLN